jgi:hypothetical protein
MADHDIEGQMQVLLRLLVSSEWRLLWAELAIRVESFVSLGVSVDTPDGELWRLCQTRQIVLVTGNRNNEGPESLEAVIQEANSPTSLPVLIIGEPQRIFSGNTYAHHEAIKVTQ